MNTILNEEVMKYMGVAPYENHKHEGDGYFLRDLIKFYGQSAVDDAFKFARETFHQKEKEENKCTIHV